MMNLMKIKTPSNLYLWWNFGSMILIIITFQIIIGFILSMNYMINKNMFISSFNIYFNINYGWMIRMFHSNLTSLIFIIMIIHIKRNLFFKTFYNKLIWLTGLTMFLLLMIESFLGYSLIWNQMSYWAMMVITNFISSIPILGNKLIKLIWGSFNINIILINRFYSIHFITPFFIIMISIIHLLILHKFKSTNPLGINNNIDLINLNPNLIIKDFNLLILIIMIFINLNLIYPFFFNNPDNFIKMNYFKTPSHIEPEWYFLFFYSILRSINNKINGLMILILSLMMFFLFPFLLNNKFQTNYFFINKILIIIFIQLILFISLMSKFNTEYPFNLINKIFIYLYFYYFIINYMLNYLWNLKF